MKPRWKKIALGLLLVFACIGIGTTVFVIPFAYHYFSDMNRKVDTAPMVSVPFNIRQARSKQVINDVPIPHRGLFALTVRLRPKAGVHLTAEEIDSLFRQENHVPFVLKYRVQTTRNPGLHYGEDTVVADFYRQEEGDFLFSVYSKFISSEERLTIQAENISAVPEFAPFDAFLEFGERRPSK